MTGQPLAVEVIDGAGPPCLLVHGILSSRAHWSLNLATLSEVCRPVVVELYGHGRSPSPEDADAYSPASYVAEFERIRTSLGAPRWLICGASLGAALTLRYALDHPDRVVAQVFTNSNSALADDAWVERIQPEVEEAAAALVEGGRPVLDRHPLHPRHVRHVPDAAKAELVRTSAEHDPRGIAFTMLHTVPASPVLGRIASNRVPTLLVVGKKEDGFAASRALAEATMPRLEVVGVSAGHAVNLQQADAFNRAVTAFFAGASAAKGRR